MAYVIGCNVAQTQNTTTCGEYLVSLDKNTQTYVQAIQNLPYGESCSYRVHSKCGYPAANIFIHDVNLANDFYITYGTDTGLPVTKDLGWDYDVSQTTEWNG